MEKNEGERGVWMKESAMDKEVKRKREREKRRREEIRKEGGIRDKYGGEIEGGRRERDRGKKWDKERRKGIQQIDEHRCIFLKNRA